jgi:hypothetical protein
MFLQVASEENLGPLRRSAPASAAAANDAVGSPAESSAPEPAVPSPAQFNTDLQVDSQHQIYYAFVDASTGDVVFQIPPEALREIGESLKVPLAGDASVPSVDVKS